MQMAPLHVRPLSWQAQHQPQQLAIINGEQHLTYAQLQQRVLSYAQQLAQQGLQPGSRLACCSQDSLSLITLLLAAHYLACSICPLNTHQPPAALEDLLKTMGATHYWGQTALSLPSLQIKPDTSTSLQHESKFQADVAASMVFTSGSSSTAKAVVHSWKNHYYSACGSQHLISLSSPDRWLLSLPLYHIGGQAILWRSLLAGTPLVIPQQGQLSLTELEQQHVSHLSLVPTQLYRLLQCHEFKADSLPLQHILIGGAACPQDLLKQALARGFKVYSSYGSSELSSQVATCAHHQGQQHYQLLPYCQARIQQGELQLCGETLALGYWHKTAIAPLSALPPWFATGDCGQLTEQGLQISGRINNMFVCAGENIQPEEIEAALQRHPAISQAIVLPQASPEYGYRPVALIRYAHTLRRLELEQHLRHHLAAIKLPTDYYLLPESTGLKPSRPQLAQRLQRQQLTPAKV